MKSKKVVFLFLFMILSLLFFDDGYTQSNAEPEPRAAFFRSLILPGWGHYYTDSDNWGRGALHLGADILLISGYAGLTIRSSNLEEKFITLANLRAGVDIDGRGRTFQLAIADFNNLQEYNNFQLRSRNWNGLIDEVPENEWSWISEEDRLKYNELRADREAARNQLPAIAALLVLNRVLSAVNAYSKARNLSSMPEIAVTPYRPGADAGFVATLRFSY